MTTTTRLAITEDEIRARIAAVPFWYHCIEIAPGIVTPGIDSSAYNLQRMNLPEDLTGKRILDIGAFDGFYTFECERRGAAEVIAIDGNAATGFGVVRELLGSRAPFYQMNVYDLTPATFGQFDLVLCLGVLYHLRYLLLGCGAYVILRYSSISMAAALAGSFVSAAAVIVEILFELTYARN